MYCGIKSLDLSVSAEVLLKNPLLDFEGRYSQTTGEISTHKLTAKHRGLTFTLTPRQKGGYRVEANGSIHRFSRGGVHNADDFTAADLLAALDEFVTTYGVNPFTSRLNNVEFGVNVVLPFPVSTVLSNLISYKNRPFTKEPGDGFTYYQCLTQRYVVKLYDKGSQYDLPDNVLRVEVKVLKMEYLTRRGIRLDWLADLLNVENYGPLGALLVETFTEILFDEPTIKPAKLTDRERDVYQNGRNPRFWLIPDDLPAIERPRLWKRLQRAENAFRALLSKHRRGDDWQSQTATLISQTWERLTILDDDLRKRIDKVKTVWSAENNCDKTVMDVSKKCPLLTGVSEPNAGRETVPSITENCPLLTGSKKGEMSTINPLSIVLIPDNDSSQNTDLNAGRETLPLTPNNSDKTTIKDPVSKRRINRPTATQLRENLDLLAEVEQGRKRYAKGSKENQFERAAHNLRNDESNDRNNLARRLQKLIAIEEGKPLPLFAPKEVIRLTPGQRDALDYWNGTGREVTI
ncbi:hypothetical protein [Spirosoma linguale]|uniref:Uncharacterized protein n=1 Tax=Spirosoma linguale (strain ATCC 33905 / DSM 74 / LMG 10896 / Claus 1) TaxID=504472 RepID=D2QSP5_SPILD|nr:hypothetical protein Slin_5863 [Spirosoma linguale DSM 74]